MCGRYIVNTDPEFREMRNIVQQAQQHLSEGQELKTGEIFPTNLAPVLVQGDHGIESIPMIWGFPRWDGGGIVINARAETAAVKQMFRSSLQSRRLIVPSTGFFEWKRNEGRKLKDKYLFQRLDSPMLYMAGVYTLYKQPDGTQLARFVILTTEANSSVSPLHDRMPVILGSDEKDRWLSGENVGEVLSSTGPELELEQVS